MRTTNKLRKDISKLIYEEQNRKKALNITNTFNLKEPSIKQKKVLSWWTEKSPYKDYTGIISDGSIRSGKTLSTMYSFVEWAMYSFNNQQLVFASKTIGAFRRNIFRDLNKILKTNGYKIKIKFSENLIEVSKNNKTNFFYIFGGKDESSFETIQGMTLAGVFFDEVVLMPESFVTQAMARCSVNGAKYWFTCNPSSPYHWFKNDYIDNKETKNFYYLHFTMEDNPTLTDGIKNRYKTLYTGVFYKRYILGLWVGADGLVYSITDNNIIKPNKIPKCNKYYIAGDYGTQNPMAWGFFGVKGKDVYLIAEYHHGGRETQKPKDDSQYAIEFVKWKNNLEKEYGYTQYSIFDPSASSFKVALKNKNIMVKNAKNKMIGEGNIIAGIQLVQSYLTNNNFFINEKCEKTIAEFYSYAWDSKKMDKGLETPIKAFDHHMDAVRYFFNTVIGYKTTTGVNSPII